jgi:hypothetical protein
MHATFSRSPVTAAVALAALGIAAALFFVDSAAWAGKPGGGGGGPIDTGTIYFSVATGTTYQIHSMTPSGAGKTALPVYPTSYGGPADPSRALHGGHRWFLMRTSIAGAGASGGPKNELSAIRDDGAIVRLTYTAPDASVSTLVSWGPQDATIAWYQGASSTAPAGFYAATVVFDGSGNVAGLVSTPASPTFPRAATAVGTAGLDWSPDGARIVVSEHFSPAGSGDTYELRIIDVATGASTACSTPVSAYDPAWSPDGTSIAYHNDLGGFSLHTVTVSTGVDTTVLAGGTSKGVHRAYVSPRWSPNGVNLAFQYSNSHDGSGTFVGRSVPTGGTATNLSSDLPSSTCLVIGWR